MRTYIIRENAEADGVSVAFYNDAMPPQTFADYSDTDSALAAHSDLDWHEITDEEREADEISGDVLYIAQVPE